MLPIGALFALPGTLVAAILHATWNPGVKGTDNVEVSRFGDPAPKKCSYFSAFEVTFGPPTPSPWAFWPLVLTGFNMF